MHNIDTSDWEYPCNAYNLNRIRHRCEVLLYMGDASVHYSFNDLSDKELYEEYKWVLSSNSDCLDKIKIKKVVHYND